MVTPEDIKGWIEQGITDCSVEITGDGQHFYAVIVSTAFAEKTEYSSTSWSIRRWVSV